MYSAKSKNQWVDRKYIYIIINQENLTLLDLPEKSLFMIPVSIMTKIPMKRTDDPSIHMKQILRPFSSSQVKKDWIFKHTSSGFIPLNGFGTAWQNCKLGLWMYQLWRKPASLSSHFSQWHSKLRMVKVSISPTGLEVHLKHNTHPELRNQIRQFSPYQIC